MRPSQLPGLVGLLPSLAVAIVSSDGTGRLPALGWNSWNEYECEINETLFLEVAQHIVDLGLKDVGYEYVNIDDCWSDKDQLRDPETQQLRAHPTKFPHGIQWLADRVHELGLKIGIYSDAGSLTCAKYEGSLEHEDTDAATFAEWGIDYLKYDNCNIPPEWQDVYDYQPARELLRDPAPPGYDWSTSNSAIRFNRMRDALFSQSRTIQYSMCIWGSAFVERWGNATGHSWRMWADIRSNWASIAEIINHAAFKANTTNFWSHGDWDMLEVGNGALTYEESRTHFAFWAALKSPLLIGTRLSGIKPEILDILLNKELLAFNQDPVVGEAALPYKWGFLPENTYNQTYPAEFWSGLSSRGTHVFILNTLGEARDMTVVFDEVPGLSSGVEYVIHDMWTGEDLGMYSDEIDIVVNVHDTAALLVVPAGETMQRAYVEVPL